MSSVDVSGEPGSAPGARHKLALVYLGDVSLSMTDVACLLGYAEGAAFTRAFKRWTGRAPSQFRSAY